MASSLPPPQLEKCSQDLGTSTKAVSSAIAQLLSEATQGNENYTGKYRDLVPHPHMQTHRCTRVSWLLLRNIDIRGVTVHKIYGLVCTSVLKSWFGTFSIQQFAFLFLY